MKRVSVLGVLALCALGVGRPALLADPFTPGNIIVSTDNFLYEYTLDGRRVQAIPIDRPPPGSDPEGRGVAFDEDGNVHIYNGTFHPYLSTLDPAAGSWVHHTFDGWSTVNNITFGGVATCGSYVYASDCATAYDGAPNGIVRFDRANDYAGERFEDGNDYIMLTMGLDGLLYGLIGDGSPAGYVTVALDPASMTRLNVIRNPVELRGIAVEADSILFGITFDGTIIAFDEYGTEWARLATHVGGAGIQVTPDGLIVATSSFGNVIVTDDTLTTFTRFSVGSTVTTFAAVVPDP